MMTTMMMEAFGYDDLGNCSQLLAEADRLALHDISRASGDVTCAHCGVQFSYHPKVQGALWATRTCRDGLVKL